MIRGIKVLMTTDSIQRSSEAVNSETVVTGLMVITGYRRDIWDDWYF